MQGPTAHPVSTEFVILREACLKLAAERESAHMPVWSEVCTCEISAEGLAGGVHCENLISGRAYGHDIVLCDI